MCVVTCFVYVGREENGADLNHVCSVAPAVAPHGHGSTEQPMAVTMLAAGRQTSRALEVRVSTTCSRLLLSDARRVVEMWVGSTADEHILIEVLVWNRNSGTGSCTSRRRKLRVIDWLIGSLVGWWLNVGLVNREVPAGNLVLPSGLFDTNVDHLRHQLQCELVVAHETKQLILETGLVEADEVDRNTVGIFHSLHFRNDLAGEVASVFQNIL